MQDDSKTSPQKKVCQGKCIYPSIIWPYRNKMFDKKKYFTINFIHLVYKARQILPTFTNQCHCVHLHSQWLHLLTLTPNIPNLFTVAPRYIIISPNALDIQHFLNPFTVAGGEMRLWHFMWFLICGFARVLFLSFKVNFYWFSSHFPVTTLGLDLFSGAYLNTCFCGASDWE